MPHHLQYIGCSLAAHTYRQQELEGIWELVSACGQQQPVANPVVNSLWSTLWSTASVNPVDNSLWSTACGQQPVVKPCGQPCDRSPARPVTMLGQTAPHLYTCHSSEALYALCDNKHSLSSLKLNVSTAADQYCQHLSILIRPCSDGVQGRHQALDPKKHHTARNEQLTAMALTAQSSLALNNLYDGKIAAAS